MSGRGGKRQGSGRKSRLVLSEREELLMRKALFLQDRALFRAICQHGRQGVDGRLDDEEAYTRSVQQTAFGMLRLGAGQDVYKWHLEVQDRVTSREKASKPKTETTSILMAAMANLPGAMGQSGAVAAQIEHTEGQDLASMGFRMPGTVDVESIGLPLSARSHDVDLFAAAEAGDEIEEAGARDPGGAPPGSPPLPHPHALFHPRAENFCDLGALEPDEGAP